MQQNFIPYVKTKMGSITFENLTLKTLNDPPTPPNDGGYYLKVVGGNDQEIVGRITWKQIELGKKLKAADYWVVSEEPLTYWKNTMFINPTDLGIYFYFLTEEEVVLKQEQLKASADKVKILSVNANDKNECDFLNSAIQGYNNIFGMEFYGGNDFPRDEEGLPISFDRLCKGDDLKRLGILRMDVDNLGSIFCSGVSSNKNSFSRYAALSRNLGWFFSGYLNTLWKEYQLSTFIVYSGGDDLFVVGDWSDVLKLGTRIQEDFSKFTCKNPSLTLSGGLVLVGPKYPIKRGAADSEAAEKAAKSYRFVDGMDNEQTKNAITFLGMSLQWNNEYRKVGKVKDELVQLLRNNRLPKSFISKVNNHALESWRDESNKFVVNLKMYWMMAYDFGRMKEREKDLEVKSLIDRCKLDIVNNTFAGEKNASPYHAMELWHLATRWAELEIR